MPFIYAVMIETDAKDDVNQLFRDNKLQGEVITDRNGTVFICPQISKRRWETYPLSYQLKDQFDHQWDQVIKASLQYMQSRYSVKVIHKQPSWLAINQPHRCSQMALHIDNADMQAS
ncbi:hypothetical protein [Shewanella waksmanii]|uniref:hypothetical protein n=1 Tax=Shewanella waksmanii TaxID=213783 RepID=UPI003735EF27